MIITKTPLRISFVGGGSDLPAFYREEPGCVVSATIDKYVYVAVNEQFEGRVLAHYRATEDVAHARDLHHDRMRTCLLSAGITDSIEVTSMADVPGSSGLGSSSAFTVGLLHALRPGATPESYAAHACQIELDDLRSPIGKQDQYAAAFGGLRIYVFHPDEIVTAEALPIEMAVLLNDHILLFDTGIRRDASPLLACQGEVMRDSRRRADVRAMANLAHAFRDALLLGGMAECGAIMDAAWRHKRNVGASTDAIDGWYAAAQAAGAWGGKVCGAGGGGFMLFMAPPERHGAIIRALDLRHVPIAIEPHGSQVIYAD